VTGWIGVAKEIKQAERRVTLTPAGAHKLVARGSDVVVEAGAGIGFGMGRGRSVTGDLGGPRGQRWSGSPGAQVDDQVAVGHRVGVRTARSSSR
jgi:hypothetical protein